MRPRSAILSSGSWTVSGIAATPPSTETKRLSQKKWPEAGPCERSRSASVKKDGLSEEGTNVARISKIRGPSVIKGSEADDLERRGVG